LHSDGGWHGHCSGANGEYPPHSEKSVFSATTRWLYSVSLALSLLAAATGTGIVCPTSTVAQDEVKEAMAEDGRPYPQGEEKGSRGVSRRGAVHEHYRHGEAGGGGAPSGTVKSSKTVGGHPVLVNAAMDAMKRWKCEPAPTESRGIVGIQVPTSGLDGEKKTRPKSEL